MVCGICCGHGGIDCCFVGCVVGVGWVIWLLSLIVMIAKGVLNDDNGVVSGGDSGLE